MAMSNMTDDKIESNYKGSALLRLLSYMKPYIGLFIIKSVYRWR